MRTLKRLLAVVLSLAMVIGSLTVTAFAATTWPTSNLKNQTLYGTYDYVMNGNIYGSSGVALTVSNGANITIDADTNSKRIYYNGSSYNAIINNGNLSITSSKNYIYNYHSNENYAIKNSGTLTLTSGTKVTQIYNSNEITPYNNPYAIENVSGGVLNIDGAIIAGHIDNKGTINEITSGYFYDDLTVYCAEGYKCEALTDAEKTDYPGCKYKVVVGEPDPVASVTIDGVTTNYSKIDKAITAFVAGSGSSQTIKLLDSVSYDTRIELAAGTSSVGKEYTIDLNGNDFTYSVSNGILIRAYDTFNLIDTSGKNNCSFNFTSSEYFFYLNQNVKGINIDIGNLSLKGTDITKYCSGSSATLTITSGKFSIDPSSYTKNTVTGPTNGLYTVTVPPVRLEMNGATTSYDTLDDAITAIDNCTTATTATITILKDVEVSTRIETSNALTKDTIHDITIDLLDNTITYTGSKNGVILARAYSYFTIKGTGTINSQNNEYIFSANLNGKIIIKGGHFTNSSTKENKYLVYASYKSCAVVSGGMYEFNPSSHTYTDTTTSEEKTVSYNIVGEVHDNGDGTYKAGFCTIDDGDIGYDLQTAMQEVSDDGTLTLFADGLVSSEIFFDKSNGSVSASTINITDDGNKHELNFYVAASNVNSKANGEIVVGAGKTLNITATAANNIVIKGVSESGLYSNSKPLFYLATSGKLGATLNLTNVEMTSCNLSTGNGACISTAGKTDNDGKATTSITNCNFHNNTAGAGGGSCIYNRGTLNITSSTFSNNTAATYGTIYNTTGGQLTLTSTSMTNNTAKLGAAIYNLGSASIYIKGSNTITGNRSSGAGGAVYVNALNNVYGKVYLNGAGNTIKDNVKQTESSQEGSSAVLDGTPSDICINTNESFEILSGAGTGEVGIDASFATTADSILVKSNQSKPSDPTLKSLFNDADDDLRAYYNSNKKIYWSYSEYSLTIGSSKTQVDGTLYSYKVNDVSVAQDIHDPAKNLAVQVDSGKITVDWDNISIDNITTINVIDTDGTGHTYTTKPSGTSDVKAVSIQVSDTFTNAEITGFIKNLVFTTAGNAVEQSIYAGIQGTIPDGYIYFAGGYYKYESTAARWDAGDNNAALMHGQYPSILNQTDNDIVNFIAGNNETWLAAVKAYDAWYWKSGANDGVQISANADTTEGLDGAYVNWASATPFTSADYERIYMNSEGKWLADDGLQSKTYVIKVEDDNATTAKQTFMLTKDSKNILTAVDVSLESDVAMTYYFTFSDAYKDSATSYVSIQVDDETAVEKSISELVAEQTEVSEGGYAITVNFSPKKLNAKVTIKVCDGAGAETTYGTGDGYNYLYYANTVMANYEDSKGDNYTQNYSVEHYAMVKALLHYGAAAQTQFEYNTSNLTDNDIEAAGSVDASKIDTDNCVFTQSSGEIFTKASLVSDSMTGLRIYFTGSATTADVNGVDYTVQSDSTGNYVEFPIAAMNLAKIYTVIINDESCNINAYYVINQIVNDSSASTNAKTTAFRLFEFGEAAADYFGTYAPSASISEAIINTAFAYYAHGADVQYDQKKMGEEGSYNFSWSGDGNTSRRQFNISAEDITSYNEAYLDCSSFIQAVMQSVVGTENTFTAFGYTSVDTSGLDTYDMAEDKTYGFAEAAEGTSDFVAPGLTGYCRWGRTTKGQMTLASLVEEQGKTMDDLYAALRYNLQPGDVVVKYRAKNAGGVDGISAHGHVILWTGDGFIHCTGFSYDYENSKDKVESSGSIFYVPASQFEEVFDLASFTKVVIYRPQESLDTSMLTDYGTARQQVGPLKVGITSKCNGGEVYKGTIVPNGGTLSIDITLDNSVLTGAMGTSRTVNLKYVLPDGVTLLDAGDASVSGTTLTWSDIAIGRDEKVTKTISVTIDSNAATTDSYGRKVITFDDTSGKGIASLEVSAAGRSAKAITFCLEDIYILDVNTSEKSTLSGLIVNAANGTTSYTGSGIEIVNAILEAANTASNFRNDYTTDDGLFSALFTSAYNSTYSYYYERFNNNSDSGIKYISQNLAGGRRVVSSYYIDQFSYNGRARCVDKKNLNAGDIIACANIDETSGEVTSYTYFMYPTKGGDIMLKISGDTCSKENADDVLDELLGAYSTWAVLTVMGR